MARRVRKSRADNQRWNQMIASLRLMNFAFNNIKLYPPTHAEVVTVVNKLHETVTPIIDEQDDIGFGFMDELLYIEGSMSLEETAANQMLVDRFNKCRVKYLTMMKGLTTDDLLKFFQILNAEATKPTTDHPGELIDKNGIKTIHIVEAEVDDLASKSKTAKKKTLLDWYEKAIGTLKEAQEQLKGAGDLQPDLKPLYRAVDDMIATIRNKGYAPFLLLPALSRDFDPHLAHSVNVAVLCCALGDAYGLNSGQISTLCACAYLHDLGRLTIPVEWTQDHTPLSPEERLIAAQHADWGFLLLARNKDVPTQLAVLAALHHRDAWGPQPGDGYAPDVLHKVLNLADAYDLAAASGRYYWKKHRRDRVLDRLLNKRGVLYDPTLVKLLVNCVGYYPVGTFVRLDDGQKAVVVRPNPANVSRPKVYLYEAAPPPPEEGKAAPDEPPPVIADLADFNETGTGFINSIAAVIEPPKGLDVFALLDKKKEYLLSYAL